MNLTFSSYPKCECGSDMVPILKEARASSDWIEANDYLMEQTRLLWKCVKCGKVVDFNKKKE